MQRAFPKGFSMNLVLIIWGLCGGLFIYAFLANFRTMLLMPQYEKPVDSAQEILDRGMIPFVIPGGDFYKQFLKESSNPTYQKLGEIVLVPKDDDQWYKMVREGILGSNTHVHLGDLCLSCYDGKFHESKDVLEGTNPFTTNIVNKKWSLAEEFSYHLRVFQQVKDTLCRLQ